METNKNNTDKFFDEVAKISKDGSIKTPEANWPQMHETKTPSNNTPGTNQNTNPLPQHTDIKTNKMENNNCNIKNRKLITKDIDVATLSAAGNYPVLADFGKEYKRILGYAFMITSLGGLTTVQVKLGLSDNSRTILDPTLIDWHTFSTSVPVEKRLNKEEIIEMANGSVWVNVKISAALSSAFQVQLVALVERD